MKSPIITIAAFALVLSPVVATAQSDVGADRMKDSDWLVDASKLDDLSVSDKAGNDLGEIEEVLIDPASGQVRYAVLEVDKAWQFNDPKIAVPWGSFEVTRGSDEKVRLTLDATKDKLTKAPRYKVGDANRLFSKEASQPIYSYWSIYWFDTADRGAGATSGPSASPSPGMSPASSPSPRPGMLPASSPSPQPGMTPASSPIPSPTGVE